jgi:hypothetical protein
MFSKFEKLFGPKSYRHSLAADISKERTLLVAISLRGHKDARNNDIIFKRYLRDCAAGATDFLSRVNLAAENDKHVNI